jgi:hypothetical protein
LHRREETKSDPVFLGMLTAIAGSEGGVERIHPTTIDLLADMFAAGRDYDHRELPCEGDRIVVSPRARDDDVIPPEPLDTLIVSAIGWRFLYEAQQEGRTVYLAIDPGAELLTFPMEQDDEDDADAWKRGR